MNWTVRNFAFAFQNEPMCLSDIYVIQRTHAVVNIHHTAQTNKNAEEDIFAHHDLFPNRLFEAHNIDHHKL